MSLPAGDRGSGPGALAAPGEGDRAEARAAVEVPVYIPSRGEGVGAVVTVPADPGSTVGAVLMAGRARDRAHRNGMWVRTAAELAARGAYVVRLDYPGVGSSSGPPRQFDLERPPSWAVEDACRFLAEHTPVRDFLLVATCFGGRVVLDAAPRIPGVFGVAVVSSPAVSRQRTLRFRLRVRVARALGRQPPVDRRISAHYTEQRREGGQPLEWRASPGFLRAMRRTAGRAPVYFLYGETDFLREELTYALSRLKLPRDRYEVDLLPGSIHTFRSLPVQRTTVDRIVRWFERRMEEVRPAR